MNRARRRHAKQRRKWRRYRHYSCQTLRILCDRYDIKCAAHEKAWIAAMIELGKRVQAAASEMGVAE